MRKCCRAIFDSTLWLDKASHGFHLCLGLLPFLLLAAFTQQAAAGIEVAGAIGDMHTAQ